MKFTQEDVESTIDEIKKMLRCESVEHVKDARFNITADFWTEQDLSYARQIGLDVQGVGCKHLGKGKVGKFDVDKWGIEIEVEYIGKHRIVMG